MTDISSNQPIQEDQIDPDLAAALAARFGDPKSETPPEAPNPKSDPESEVEEEEEEQEEELNEEGEEEDKGEDEEEEETPNVLTFTYMDAAGNPATATITPEQAAAYYAFDQRLRSDRAYWEYINSYGSQPASPPQAPSSGVQSPPTAATPELDLSQLDLDDPNIKFLVDRVTALSTDISNLRETAARHEQVLSSDQEAQATTLINAGRQAFQSKYPDLSTQEMDSISEAAARSGLVNSYMQGIHPITGQPVNPDPLAALDLAFEAAYWANPAYREKAIAAEAEAARKARIKKSKAGSLAPSSGSATRSTPTPSNDKERRDAMIAAVAQDMGLE